MLHHMRMLVCPHCSATDVRRSRRRTFEHLLSFLGFYPYRCQACSRRFVVRPT